jgi:tRNA-dihydrouridine synthase 4
MGVSHITIHGRTRHQASTEPVNLPGLKFAVECISGEVPTVANGDLWILEDAVEMRKTGVNGVMAARGILAKYVKSYDSF